jgi:hypothetical protein
MADYTPTLVERMLRSYVPIRDSINGGGTVEVRNEQPVMRPQLPAEARLPLGRTKANPSWPFMTKPKAQPVRDGKRKAQQIQELHCAVLDIEAAFPRLSDDDQWIIVHHLILQTHELEDVARRYHLAGISGARMRVFRAVLRLTRYMEAGHA